MSQCIATATEHRTADATEDLTAFATPVAVEEEDVNVSEKGTMGTELVPCPMETDMLPCPMVMLQHGCDYNITNHEAFFKARTEASQIYSKSS